VFLWWYWQSGRNLFKVKNLETRGEYREDMLKGQARGGEEGNPLTAKDVTKLPEGCKKR